jgi:transcription-repair coupling factor (superfamily II helicase)
VSSNPPSPSPYLAPARYLLYPPGGDLTEKSVQRLHAMEDLTELGSGFDLASRDLEIRGAGSIFGVEQSGMAGRVGFDLYMRILRKAIKKLKVSPSGIASGARSRRGSMMTYKTAVHVTIMRVAGSATSAMRKPQMTKRVRNVVP